MQITLNPIQAQVLEKLVQQGQYPSFDDAINTALLLLIDDTVLPDAEHNLEYSAWVESVRRKINTAREQAQNNEVLTADVVLAQLRARVQATTEAV